LDRTLSLSFSIDNTTDQPTPIVVILVEGHDLFGLLGQIGFAPSELFSPNEPLIPTSAPQRIAIYRCYCGEAGCGCIAPLITRVGDEVHWSDFRDFTGVYTTPEIDTQPAGGRLLPIPTLRFDSADYEAAVHRGTNLVNATRDERAAASADVADHGGAWLDQITGPDWVPYDSGLAADTAAGRHASESEPDASERLGLL
jgi:hypothetical protein